MNKKKVQEPQNIKRVIAEKFVAPNLPSLIFIIGIHGNEVSGLQALKNVLQYIETHKVDFKINFYALAGNINAIKKGIRYETKDLNRMWSDEYIHELKQKETNLHAEEKEFVTLYKHICDISEKANGPMYFIDLHTTSSQTIPYITASDTLKNRDFSKKFPVPIVLGIEEYIHGPLLTYVSEYGHVGIGFEAGQHFEHKSVIVNEAFIWMVLHTTKCVDKKLIEDYESKTSILHEEIEFENTFLEIIDKYQIDEEEDFAMKPGFDNFQSIRKEQVLATNKYGNIISNYKALIFMPLYQSKGEDGFFVIKKMTKLWLFATRFMRKINVSFLLQMIKGISIDSMKRHVLNVQLVHNSPFIKKLVHLFGYRQSKSKNETIVYSSSERKPRKFI